jgi:hypothetical protein
MAAKTLENEKIYIEKRLHEKELGYLKATIRSNNIAIYSGDEKNKENRCRFTQNKEGQFMLSMANYSGRWEATPFEGTLEELLEMVIEQFPWTLTDYEQDHV